MGVLGGAVGCADSDIEGCALGFGCHVRPPLPARSRTPYSRNGRIWQREPGARRAFQSGSRGTGRPRPGRDLVIGLEQRLIASERGFVLSDPGGPVYLFLVVMADHQVTTGVRVTRASAKVPFGGLFREAAHVILPTHIQ